jgi:hypothetical protein
LPFVSVAGTALSMAALRLAGLAAPAAAFKVGFHDVGLFRVALYALWAAATALALVRLLAARGVSPAQLGWTGRLASGQAVAAVVATAAAVSLWPPVEAACRAVGIPTYWEPGRRGFVLPQTPWEFVVAAVAGLAVVPAAEETLFRGYVLAVLATRMSRPAALVVHSLLFALYHLGAGPGVAAYIFFWSFAPAVLFLRYRSVYPPLVMHALNNAFVDLALPLLLPRGG